MDTASYQIEGAYSEGGRGASISRPTALQVMMLDGLGRTLAHSICLSKNLNVYGGRCANRLAGHVMRLPVLTVNCMCRAAARFCYAGRCPRPWPPEGQMDCRCMGHSGGGTATTLVIPAFAMGLVASTPLLPMWSTAHFLEFAGPTLSGPMGDASASISGICGWTPMGTTQARYWYVSGQRHVMPLSDRIRAECF